jgi:hypothetical protein
MIVLAVILALCLIYVGWRVATDPKLRARDLFRWKLSQGIEPDDTQPVAVPAPKPFTPLEDMLKKEPEPDHWGRRFEDSASVAAKKDPLPPERPLPHVRKRKGKRP